MGTKLSISPNDDLFNVNKISVSGISGGCYCCGQQIHITFKNIGILPVAKIDDSHFYVFLCDLCEEDIKFLGSKGFKTISYDILWLIQEELNQKTSDLERKNGECSDEDRNDILLKLYSEAYNKLGKPKKD